MNNPIYTLAEMQSQSYKKEYMSKWKLLGEWLYVSKGETSQPGTFILVGSGSAVYRIEYDINGHINKGWVRFGGLIGSDWRL